MIWEKYKEILKRAKCGVYLDVNDHRSMYESIETAIRNIEYQEELTTEIKDGMRNSNTIVKLQVYLNTPVGFYLIYHYDVEKAIEEMYREIVNNDH